MGYIYGIKNRINNKWYVGQSIYYPKERWRVEIAGYKQHNMVISKAIKKYGVENFDFIILEKDIIESELDEREIFWIKEKNSYLQGYNSTRGGKSHIGYRIPYDIKDIAQYYKDNPNLSCRDVAKYFGIFHETVSSILKEFNIEIRKGKHPITIKKDDQEWQFFTYRDAAQFFIDNKIATCGIEQLRKNIVPKKDNYKGYEIIRG